MKKWNCLLAAVTLALSVLLTGCGGQQEEPVSQASPEDLHHVKIHIKDYGTISVELDSSAAPVTVENFMDLAGEGFYDGLTFHRMVCRERCREKQHGFSGQTHDSVID